VPVVVFYFFPRPFVNDRLVFFDAIAFLTLMGGNRNGAVLDALHYLPRFILVLVYGYAVKTLFSTWLRDHYPTKAGKVLNRVRAVRGGELNDPRFGSRMKGEGLFARQIASLFHTGCRRAGIEGASPTLSTRHFLPAPGTQLDLF